jgi:DNA-binding response OmpR family regulator
MTEKTVLIVDDDRELTGLLADYLGRYGISCHAAHDVREGLKLFRQKQPVLMILDIMLPDGSGFDLCREIRQASMTPIIMLSARGDVYDRILGLELGADDYLPKPFEPRELLARIESVLRRGNIPDTEVIILGRLEIHQQLQRVQLDGAAIDLTATEYRCLEYLVRNRRRVMTRDLILAELRGLDWELDNRTVDILISRLRKKLQDDPASPQLIATVRGSGYRFIGGDPA